jgi:hypothetical protein
MIYIFKREDGNWYPLELPNDETAKDNAESNPGTSMVKNVESGEVVWASYEQN